jgi:hypothetical protein
LFVLSVELGRRSVFVRALTRASRPATRTPQQKPNPSPPFDQQQKNTKSGGQIVPTSTRPDELCINGMSFSKRGSPWCNSALVVAVSPADWAHLEAAHGPLAGVELQVGVGLGGFWAVVLWFFCVLSWALRCLFELFGGSLPTFLDPHPPKTKPKTNSANSSARRPRAAAAL